MFYLRVIVWFVLLKYSSTDCNSNRTTIMYTRKYASFTIDIQSKTGSVCTPNMFFGFSYIGQVPQTK